MNKKQKVLMVAHVGAFLGFELNDIRILLSMGYEVHCAANFTPYQEHRDVLELKSMDGVVMHQIDFVRSPFSKQTIIAYKQLNQLLQGEHFDLIHCHTPVGGILTRLAARKYRKDGTKVIYTAHGFHFFKGAPLVNWLLFYPAEWMCSWWTDMLITINQEDYQRAKKRFHAKRTEYIPGVGIDLKKFQTGQIDREEKRKALGLNPEDKMLLSVGELNKNKNHETVIRAVAKLNHPKVHYFIAGKGDLKDYLEKLAEELGVSHQIHLLGFRCDVAELLQMADIYVFPSHREGLSVALMEAIACKVPVICSAIRGNTDLVKNKDCLFKATDVEQATVCIHNALENDNTSVVEAQYTNLQKYDVKNVGEMMQNIYNAVWSI